MQDNKEEQTWQSLAFIWIGSMISVPGLLLGGTLIAGMSFWTAILTALVGYGVIVIGMIFQGIQSSDLRKPTVQVVPKFLVNRVLKKNYCYYLSHFLFGLVRITSQRRRCGVFTIFGII